MQIVYDPQIFSLQEYGGISRYIYEVAIRIHNFDNVDEKILAFAYINQYLRSCPKNLVVGDPASSSLKENRLLYFKNLFASSVWLHQHKPDIVHETYYSPIRTAARQTKTVITVHDMIHEKFASLRQKESKIGSAKVKVVSAIKRSAVKRADHIICVSKNTQQDLVEYLGVPIEKTSVIYHGGTLDANFGNAENAAMQDMTFSEKPYLLYVGKRNWYKNFQGFMQAYASILSLRRDFNIVCFGGGSFSQTEISMFQDLNVDLKQVIHLNGNDQMLASLYRKAAIFVYPSLYEGFGIPPLEAMLQGCPVACSNNSSLPEVVGEAAELFDPYQIESIAHALTNVAYSSSRSATLIQLGKERTAQFSWDKCADQTHQVYAALI